MLPASEKSWWHYSVRKLLLKPILTGMYKQVRYITLVAMMLFSFMQAIAQIAMPDSVCVGTNRMYRVNDPTSPSSYTWKIDGITQTSNRNEISITWNTTGIFLLTVQEHSATGCDADIRSGLVYVNTPPVANAGQDTIICYGSGIRLKGSGGILYQWSPSTYLSNASIANPIANIPVPGNYNYILNVSSTNGCKSLKADTVLITILPPAKVFAGNDTSIAISQSLQLNAVDINNSGFTNYSWSPAFGLNNSLIKNPVAILNNNFTYTITAKTANGCTAKDAISITVFGTPKIYVPTAFTPNNDGKNDVLRPILSGIKELKYFAVFNRYGQQVFITSVQGLGWNGLVNGEMQNTGAFAWMAEAIDYKGNSIKRKGMAVLIK